MAKMALRLITDQEARCVHDWRLVAPGEESSPHMVCTHCGLVIPESTITTVFQWILDNCPTLLEYIDVLDSARTS